MIELRSIRPASVFRVTVLLFVLFHGAIGLLAALLLNPAFSSFSSSIPPGMGYGMGWGPATRLTPGAGAILFLFLGIVNGFILSLLATLMAWLYNVVAGWVGGIRFRVRDEAPPGTPQS
ncbi:MAG: DUF3566 domain-containing protein [Clostridiales bacterium]|nr:DUF3566 domain-containing protein [Clostridiales bacterium]